MATPDETTQFMIDAVQDAMRERARIAKALPMARGEQHVKLKVDYNVAKARVEHFAARLLSHIEETALVD